MPRAACNAILDEIAAGATEQFKRSLNMARHTDSSTLNSICFVDADAFTATTSIFFAHVVCGH